MYWESHTAKLLHEERLKEAEKEQLARIIQKAQRDADKGYNPALAWVGQRIIDLGSKLVQVSQDPQQSLN